MDTFVFQPAKPRIHRPRVSPQPAPAPPPLFFDDFAYPPGNLTGNGPWGAGWSGDPNSLIVHPDGVYVDEISDSSNIAAGVLAGVDLTQTFYVKLTGRAEVLIGSDGNL